jgi:ABC-type uncharacterized transport system substrate-binding protein
MSLSVLKAMRRRAFIRLLGGMLTWPLAARAQSRSMRIIGFLSAGQPADSAAVIDVLRRGLKDSGLIEGHNVAIEFRWAEGNVDRLPMLATELVDLQASAILAVTNAAALAAKSATATIPIVFAIGGDPVHLGLVSNIERPGGNVTGISALTAGLDAKRVELLHQLVANAKTIGMLVNRADPGSGVQLQEAVAAASKLGLELAAKSASSDTELESAFAALEKQVGALLIPNDSFFNSRSKLLVGLAARRSLPTLYPWREYVEIGGLMSLGPNLSNGYRQATNYVSRILRGAKPGDLPVMLPGKFDLVINTSTAAKLGITIPRPLLSSASQLIR